jgi:hypothetical protein
MKLIPLSILCLLTTKPVFSQQSITEEKWETINQSANFITKKKDSKDKSIYAFKGETLADVPISKILSVFFDPTKRKNWVDRFEKQEDLEIKSPLNKIYWIRFKLPFFMSDRDYILEIKSEIDTKAKVVTAKIKSTTHPKKGLDNCCVRAEAFGTFYRFEARGKKTYVEVVVHTDPKGWLPAWLINLIQKNWPYKTLTRLIDTAKSPETKADPRFLAWEH